MALALAAEVRQGTSAAQAMIKQRWMYGMDVPLADALHLERNLFEQVVPHR